MEIAQVITGSSLPDLSTVEEAFVSDDGSTIALELENRPASLAEDETSDPEFNAMENEFYEDAAGYSDRKTQ